MWIYKKEKRRGTSCTDFLPVRLIHFLATRNCEARSLSKFHERQKPKYRSFGERKRNKPTFNNWYVSHKYLDFWFLIKNKIKTKIKPRELEIQDLHIPVWGPCPASASQLLPFWGFMLVKCSLLHSSLHLWGWISKVRLHFVLL